MISSKTINNIETPQTIGQRHKGLIIVRARGARRCRYKVVPIIILVSHLDNEPTLGAIWREMLN